MNVSNIYRSKDFAMAWSRHLDATGDPLRKELMNPLLLASMAITSNDAVLDAGCGNGYFLSHILTNNPKTVFAIDISPHLVEIAADKNKSDITRFEVGDISQQTIFPESSVDIAVCYNVLMEIPDAGKAVKELYRLVRPGGTAHIVVVHPLFQHFWIAKENKGKAARTILPGYCKEKFFQVNTIPGWDKFWVYARPLSYYINHILSASFTLTSLDEVTIPVELARSLKADDKAGSPVFAYFQAFKPKEVNS